MAELAEAQAHTEQKLSALIDLIHEQRNGGGSKLEYLAECCSYLTRGLSLSARELSFPSRASLRSRPQR